MIYKYRYKFSVQSWPVYAVCVGAVAVAISSFLWASLLIALIFSGVAVYILYSVGKAISKVLSARVVTHDEGFSVYLSNGTKKEFQWDEVTHAGLITKGANAGAVFAYAEDTDTITQLPRVFDNFDALVAELKEHTPFKEYELAEDETITEYLHNLLVPEDADTEDDEDDGVEDKDVAPQTDGTLVEAEETDGTEEEADPHIMAENGGSELLS